MLERVDPERRRELLAVMPPRTASLVLQPLEASKMEETLANLPEKIARQIKELIHHPKVHHIDTDTYG